MEAIGTVSFLAMRKISARNNHPPAAKRFSHMSNVFTKLVMHDQRKSRKADPDKLIILISLIQKIQWNHRPLIQILLLIIERTARKMMGQTIMS